jgi:GT2 family glycosyltransferase
MTDVSVIVVTHNSGQDTLDAIESARRSADAAGLAAEVIVVDNASSDGSADRVAAGFPGARMIRNEANVGFGRANNQGFAVAQGRVWLLLNPDAVLEPPAVRVLVGALARDPAVGAVAPSVAGPGRVESAGMQPGIRSLLGHYFLLNRLLPRGRGGPWEGFALRRVTAPRRVEWASAAALALRPAAVQAVGGFDSAIFMYGEDIDLCRRLSEAGWRVWLDPRARATHAIAGSQQGISTGWVRGLHSLQARRSNRAALVVFDALLAVGLALRAFAAIAVRRDGSDTHQRRMAAGAAAALRLAIETVRETKEKPGPSRRPA